MCEEVWERAFLRLRCQRGVLWTEKYRPNEQRTDRWEDGFEREDIRRTVHAPPLTIERAHPRWPDDLDVDQHVSIPSIAARGCGSDSTKSVDAEAPTQPSADGALRQLP